MNITFPLSLVYGIIIIIIVVVMVTGFVVLLNKKVEMMYMLRPYTYAIEDRGHLLPNEIIDIESGLIDMGIYNITIEVNNENCVFGDLVSFIVSGEYKIDWITGFLKHESKVINYCYQREVYVKRIIN